ncbi:MAG: hypothetical protein QOI31_2631 [Solirubrobacterales bacterium]|jgi:UPF0755 protein|nr:hypothetical protein [Solirubrobacterales bacterium]
MSDWRDPFADDEAAREREARRAEREARRRGEETRESLGERVRSGMEGESSQPTASPEPLPPTEVAPATMAPPVETPPTQVQPAAPPPPPPRRPPSDAVHRRRMWALIGLGLLIVAVAVIGTIISRGADSSSEASGIPAGKKTIEVVVPEGYDRTQIAQVAKKAGLKGDYLAATESFKGFDLAAYGAENAQNLEGFLFPATYELFKGAKVEELVSKQLEAFETNASDIDLEGAAKEQGRTQYDLVNIAAMVEREIAVPEERELAASVINNRLEQGNPLGIDATIRYEDQNYSGQLVQSRLAEDTPYNTRTNAGLPPGPIGNPGLASLDAAAHPADSDYFFFVVKPGSCNEHTFVETEEEFAAAEQAYQDALIAEGGSPTDC